MRNSYDVIVVGAGFAGLATARELSLRGWSVAVLEARDRIGGRTWTDDRLGRLLEMGGTWVHWLQPHTWSEITRYGLEIEPSPKAETVLWVAGGKVHKGSPAEFDDLIDRGMQHLAEDSRAWFERPYEPLRRTDLNRIDHQSVIDYLDRLDLAPEE